MTTLAVTAANSAVGKALLAQLDADTAVTRVVGIDRTPVDLPAAKLDFVAADLRDAVLARVLEGVDVLVHLGPPDHLAWSDDRAFAVTVQGTRQVLEAAATAGITTVVAVSTALVYGAVETNLVPLREDAPLRADPSFPPAHHARRSEQLVHDFAAMHPDRRVVVLRPVPVLGPGVDSAVTRHLESPVLPMVRGYDPPAQFLAAGDLAAAVRLVALNERATGTYNVAAEGWLTTSDVRRLLTRPTVHLPSEVAAQIAGVLYRFRLLTVPPTALPYLMHPWVVDSQRLHELGWTPVTGQRDIVHRFVADHGAWLSVGRLRVRTARLAAALLAVMATTAAGGTWLIRRWWLARQARHRSADAPPPTRRRPGQSSAP